MATFSSRSERLVDERIVFLFPRLLSHAVGFVSVNPSERDSGGGDGNRIRGWKCVFKSCVEIALGSALALRLLLDFHGPYCWGFFGVWHVCSPVCERGSPASRRSSLLRTKKTGDRSPARRSQSS